MTGQQLKNSILQMAVQGKLVPQDPNDEPASVLLERIRKEKEQLIKDGKIKKEKKPSYIYRGAANLTYEKVGKNELVCIADEVPFEIPESWEWVRFGTVMLNRDAERIPLSVDERSKLQKIYDYYGASGIIDKVVRFLFSKHLLLIGEDGANLLLRSKPIAFIAQGQYWVNNHAHVLEAIGGLQLEYIATYINVINLSPYVTGTAQPKMNQEKMNSILVPIPPAEEQKKIIKKLNLILPFVDDYGIKQKELTQYNSKILEMLKKSILQEAVQGKLVPQEPSDEPASVLLERIRAEKKRLSQEGKIKRDKYESVIYRRDNSHYEKWGSEEENIDNLIPFEIPDSWEWIRLSAILTSTDAGKSPQCENRPRTNGEWGVIKTTAIQNGYFLAEENKVLPPKFNLQESMVVYHGDLLITRAGPRNRTGVICVVDGEPKKLILSDKTVRLSYLRNLVNPHYVMTALSSPAMQYFVIDAMTGMAASQVNISQEKMKTFLFPLPPLNEQQRIVDEVGKIFERIKKMNF